MVQISQLRWGKKIIKRLRGSGQNNLLMSRSLSFLAYWVSKSFSEDFISKFVITNKLLCSGGHVPEKELRHFQKGFLLLL